MALDRGKNTNPASTYAGVHNALIRLRGSAVSLPCYGCGRPARGWMRIRPATHIGLNTHGKIVKWSTDLEAYEPGCASCNARADHGGSLLLCPRGHVRAAWGVDSRGTCKGCQRERSRARSRAQST